MTAPRVYRSLEEIGPEFGPCALTIGNFDGVHLGHREIFRRVVEIGCRQGWTPSVMTFDPHPMRVVAPARAPRLLSTPDQRSLWMGESGIRQVLILPFNRDLSLLTPEEFVERVLAARLGAKAVLVGQNFRFGNRAAGDVHRLRELGEARGIVTEVVAPVVYRGCVISSSQIRQLIESGAVARAARLLGRPFALEGSVVAGHGVGHRQTVPTLNLATQAEVLPERGVYVTRTQDLDSPRAWPSVTNIGTRPTFDGDRLSIESFVLEGLEPPPPARIRVEFLWRLREERKFPDPAALKDQILRDAARARAYHRRCSSRIQYSN